MSTVSLSGEPVVLDLGSSSIKCGFASDELPKVLPTCVGFPKHPKVMLGGASESADFIGDRIPPLRGALRIRYPMDHGRIEHWSDMERLLELGVYNRLLASAPEDHPVLLTDAPQNPKSQRERLAQIFYEKFGAPALFFAMPAVLALYANGKTSGVVLDVGDGVTHCVPVFEGWALQHAVIRADIGGRDVTHQLQILLRGAGHVLHSSGDREIVCDMKEKLCVVGDRDVSMSTVSAKEESYTLPDGRTVSLRGERVLASEVLFDPVRLGLEYPGVDECVAKALMRCDVDLRAKLVPEIYLSGGCTLLNGFPNRLVHALRERLPEAKTIRVTAPPERKYTSWIGGAVLASLGAFRSMWISRAQYEEEGSRVLHKHSL
jgi:centractin